jgi:hypothetical protein
VRRSRPRALRAPRRSHGDRPAPPACDIGADVVGIGVHGLELRHAVDAEHRGQQHEGRMIAAPDCGVEHRRLVAHAPPGRHADRQRFGLRRVDQGLCGPCERLGVAMGHQRPGQVRRRVHADGGGLDVRRDPVDPVGPVFPRARLGLAADEIARLQDEAPGVLREIGELVAEADDHLAARSPRRGRSGSWRRRPSRHRRFHGR